MYTKHNFSVLRGSQVENKRLQNLELLEIYFKVSELFEKLNFGFILLAFRLNKELDGIYYVSNI